MKRKKLIERTQMEIEQDLKSIRDIMQDMEGYLHNTDEPNISPVSMIYKLLEVLTFQTRIKESRKFLTRLQHLEESPQKGNNIISKVKNWFKKE